MKAFTYPKRLVQSLCSIFVLVCVLVLSPARGVANILTVTSTNDAGGGSLRGAVGFAGVGDTILFDASLSGQTIFLTGGQIVLGNNLTIDGSALTSPVLISGNGASRIFLVTNSASVTLNALVITNGFSSDPGGGIFNAGSLVLSNCAVTGNTASGSFDGGGIENRASLVVSQSTFYGNNAGGFGGGIANGFNGALTVNESTFYGNSAGSGDGGAIDSTGNSVTVNQSTFSGNSRGFSGPGGIDIESGTLNLTNTIVSLNPGGDISGSINSSVSNLIGRADIQLAPLGNYGGRTQTMPPLVGSPAINAGVATAQTVDQRGKPRTAAGAPDVGAVELQTPFLVVTAGGDNASPNTLRNTVAGADTSSTVTFTINLSGQTIVLTNDQIVLGNNLTIDGSALTSPVLISGNGASRIFLVTNSASVTLNALVITNGFSSDPGGGIFNAGSLVLSNCAVTGNTASGSFDGGGIENRASLVVSQSTFYGNNAGGFGGGIANGFNGALTVNESTFYGNSAGSGDGGAIDSTGNSVTVNQSTFSGNSRGFSGPGGIDIESGTLNLTNTIVSLNPGGDISGSINSSVSNLIGRADIQLAPLGNYGGRTQTMPPLVGSPAINGGSDAVTNVFVTDQRGLPRLAETHVDVGAVEAGDAIPGANYAVVTTTNDFLNGLTNNGVSLRSAAAFVPANATVTFASTLSGQTLTLTNGQITLNYNLTIDSSALKPGVQISGNHNTRIFNVGPSATVTLQSLTMLNANGGGGDGGALLNAGTTTLNACTLMTNSTGSGGAMKNLTGSLTLNECTLFGNFTTGGGGGGIVNYATLTLNACTLTGNSAGGFGGAIYSETGAVVALNNTIAAGNNGNDIYNNGTLIRTGTNMVQLFSGANGAGGGTPVINASPQLAPPGYYGGPTPTMPLLPSSPAINAGSDGANTFINDQRGYPRIADTHVDIGAVEGVYLTNGPGTLTNLTRLGNGSIQFGFTNFADANFRVLVSTNAALPLGSWKLAGFASNNPVGSVNYQFTDTQATNFPKRFYTVISP